MHLDLRLPMGLLFTILGSLLAFAGLISPPADIQRSLGLNLNLWWGLLVLAFGAALLALAYRARPRDS